MRLLFTLLLVFCAIVPLAAQPRSATTTIYPTRLYPGENVITVTNAAGIDKIRFRASSHTTVEVPAISGCPRTIDVRISVNNATSGESVDLTVYDCNGTFGTQTLLAENWTIRREFTGEVEVGRDTCVMCEIVTTDEKMIDSIVVDNPLFRVVVPPGGPPWRAIGPDFKYSVCYAPDSVGTLEEKIRIYVHRGQPNAGLTQYVIVKPITATAIPAREVVAEPEAVDTLPPLEDPTTFRNILMPTAESAGNGRFFLGNYDLAGWIFGYGFTDEFTGLLGAVAVPDVISRLLVATVGGKYEVVHDSDIRMAVGFEYTLSSTAESDITVASPYALFSLGNRARRITVGAGYNWKHHRAGEQEFNRNAYVLTLGGDYTIARGWKVAAETYVIESSGLTPVVVTVRWFNERFAFDGGLFLDLAGSNDVRGTSTLSGEIRHLSILPTLSLIWTW